MSICETTVFNRENGKNLWVFKCCVLSNILSFLQMSRYFCMNGRFFGISNISSNIYKNLNEVLFLSLSQKYLLPIKQILLIYGKVSFSGFKSRFLQLNYIYVSLRTKTFTKTRKQTGKIHIGW